MFNLFFLLYMYIIPASGWDKLLLNFWNFCLYQERAVLHNQMEKDFMIYFRKTMHSSFFKATYNKPEWPIKWLVILIKTYQNET